MKKYFFLKATGEYGAVVIDLSAKGKSKKSIRVTGNLPKLYHGMTVDFELNEKNEVLDYTLLLSEKNKEALIKAKVDVKEYQETLNRHYALKSRGISWKRAELTADDMYRTLSFSEADKIHKEIINNSTDPVRIKAINKEIIEGARRKRKISYKIEEYLGYFDAVEQEGAYQQLMASLKMMCLQASQYKLKNGSVWDNELKQKEEFVNENIRQRKHSKYSLLTDEEISSFLEETIKNGCALEKEQLDTLWSLLDSAPCIITGGAGTGKTTVIQTLIDCYAKHYSKDNVLLIAPTGKASRRLAEKTNMPASTIHKALRKNPEDNYVYYANGNFLPHRLIIVDESSMVDTELMYDLLNAADITSKIIFVGDHNQLYPVGYGEPFFDFLQVLDVYKLTKNHRQSEDTDILANADNVLNNKALFSGKGVTVKEITFEEIGDILVGLYNADNSVQIISPYNYINVQINWFLKKGKSVFNVGDKVIMNRNTKDYCNGDLGRVIEVGKDSITVDIEGNQVEVLYDNPSKVVEDTDSEGHFIEQAAKNKETDVMLAYSITVHKMQGSEADKVVVFIPKDDRLMTKRMIYTAVTRAKKELEIYYYEL